MQNLNVQLLRQRIEEIRESQLALRAYAQTEQTEFLQNRQLSDAAKYRLLVAIEACIAICNHLVSRLANRAPETFAECFRILQEKGMISESLCQKLQQMSRFRNLIIHGYWKVDDAKVYRILKEDLDDLEAYLGSVDVFLREKIE